MGSVTSSLDKDNKMIQLKANLGNKSITVNKSVLSQYIEYANSAGVIIVKINMNNLNSYLEKLAKKYNSGNTQAIAGIAIGSTFVLSSGSMTGLFTLQSLDDSDTSNIVIPKILLDQTQGPEFINFLTTTFSKALNPDQSNKSQSFNIVMKSVIAGLNKNSSNPQTRLANILNIMFYCAYVQGINMATNPSGNMDNQNLIALFSGLITEVVSNIPDNKCILALPEYMEFTPDICNSGGVMGNLSDNLITSKGEPSNKLLLISGGLILFILLILLIVIIARRSSGGRRRRRVIDDDD